jgi:L-threonylcarbamoyladenylate synthase
MAQLKGRVELVLDGGSVPGGVPSTVVDCTGENPVILREGAVPAGRIFQVWGITG